MALTAEMLCDPASERGLTCPICHDLYNKPRCHVDCGHFACEECWTRVLHAGFDQCPSCRCVLRACGIRWNAAMEMLLGSVSIKCGEGCLWTGRADAYARHLEGCQAKRLKEVEGAMERAGARLGELSAKADSLSASLAQSRADHARDVVEKEEALNAVLEASADEYRQVVEYRKRLAAAEKKISERDEQLKLKDRALADQRKQAQQIEEVLQQVLASDADNRAAAMKGRRSRSPRSRSLRP